MGKAESIAILGTLIVVLMLLAWLVTGIYFLSNIIIGVALPTTVCWVIWIIKGRMIYYSHPTANPEKTKEELSWLDSFLTNAYAQLEGIDSKSVEYERKKDLLDRLSLLWSEVTLMVRGLEQFRQMYEDLKAAKDFESVQDILKQNV